MNILIRSTAPSIVAVALVHACAGSGSLPDQKAPAGDASTISQALTSISAADMGARIGFLASDALRGRDTPSPGLDSAAAYLARELESFGLEPAGDSGGYLQRYPFPITELIAENVRFQVTDRYGQRTLRHGTEYIADRGSPAEAMGDAVFLGTATETMDITAPPLRGAIGIMRLPGKFGRPWRNTASRARRSAQSAGARAIVLVLDSSFGTNDLTSVSRATSGRRGSLGGLREIPAFYLRHDVALEIFGAIVASGAPLKDRAIDGERYAIEGLTLSLGVPTVLVADSRPPNVVAILRGSDPALRDSYVVFSAHMDHVGVGTPDASGDSIYNGADDDASGTAALLEVAQAFSRLPIKPARSLLFLAVSGEEKGLLGSRHFADHPTVPLASIVADLNVDMIGRNAPDTIVAIGQGYSSLGPLVRGVASRHPELALHVADDKWPDERFFFRSDHFSFARKDIASLFFFAGVHEDYHRPSDEVEKIDTDKAARVARLIFLSGHAIASAKDPPKWTEKGLAEVRGLTAGSRE